MSTPLSAEERTELTRLQADKQRLESELQELRQETAEQQSILARRASHLANTPLAALFWDTEFRVLEWNPAAERIFGYSASEAIGRHALDLVVAPEAREQVDRVVNELFQMSHGVNSINANVTKSGERIICEWTNTPVRDENGKVIGVFSLAQDVTEQQRTAKALHDSETLFRSVVENAPNFIMQVDREGIIRFINRIDSDYYYAEVIEHSIYEFVVEEDKEKIRTALKRVFESGTTEEYEVRDIRNERWYQSRLAPVLDGDEVTNAVVIAVDVHDRRMEQRALRESEARFRAIAKNLPGIIFIAANDEHLSTIFASEGTNDMVGVTPEDLVSRRVEWTDLVLAEDLPTVRNVLDTALKDEKPYRLKYRVRHRDGSIRHVEEIGQGIYDQDGQLRHITGVALDVTVRHAAEQEARARTEQFRILAENIPGIAYLCKNDERYSMLYISENVEKLLGIPAAEFREDRVSFVELYHPDNASSIAPIVNNAISRRVPFHLRYRLRHADGHWVWVEEHGQGVFDEQGELRFLEGCIFDITTQREAEEALLRSKEELERLVNLRTQELRTANRLLRSDYKQQLALTTKLRESEAKFRDICENNPGPVAITRLSDSEVLYANQPLADMAHVPREDMVGKYARDFYKDPSEREQLFERLHRDGQVRDREMQLRRGNGEVIWALVSMHRMKYRDEDAVLTVAIDITGRKRFEEQLRSQMRMLRRLLHLNEQDRQLIAYEIHDGIVQYMTGAKLFLQAGEPKIASSPEAAQRDIIQSTEILTEAIEEARRLIDGLRPATLEEQGVAAAVEYLCEQTQKHFNIDVECKLDVEFNRLAPAVEMAIYRIVQEGLNNVAKHSRSPRARVTLSQRTDSLVVKVEDWGVGFSIDRVESKRYGLTGIRDRARLLGGKARIRTAEGEGTLLRVKLPLEDVLLPAIWQQPDVESSGEDSSSDWRIVVDTD